MLRIKKIISFLIAFVIMIQVTAIAESNAKYSKYVDFLNALNIVNISEEDMFKLDYGMTRGDFVIMLAKTLGFSGEYVVDEYYFDDVTEKDACYGAVKYLYNKDILMGVDGTNLCPNDPLKYNDAVKMVVCAVGYSTLADTLGGYPNGHIEVAQKLSILKNVSMSTNGIILYGDVCKLLYNMLYSDALKIDYTGNKVVYDMSSNETVLKSVFGLEEYEGIVTAAGDLSLNDNLQQQLEGKIEIDYKLYDYSGDNPEKIFGHKVKYYINEDDESSVVLIVDAASDVKEIDGHDILEETTKNLLYYEDDEYNSKKLKIDNSAFYCYNGRPIYRITDESLMPEHGSVRLIDNDRDNVYDVVIIWNYELHTVDFASEAAEIISFKDGNNIQYDEEVYKLYDKNGKKIALSDCVQWNVFAVAMSQGKDYARCIVSAEIISGTVSGIKRDDGLYYITIDGKEYRILKSVYDNLETGNSGSFSISHEGCIVGFNERKETSYGYLYKLSLDDESDEPILYFSIFTMDGELKRFEAADKIKFTYYDGNNKITNTYKNIEEAYSVIKAQMFVGGSIESQLIRYSINENGTIKAFETAKVTDASTWDTDDFCININTVKLTEEGKITKPNANVRSGYVQALNKGEQYAALTNGETKVFYITDDENDWRIYTIKQFGEKDMPSMRVYDIKEDGIASIVVAQSQSKISDTFESARDPVVCIEKIYTSITEDDEIQYVIEGFSNKGNEYICYTQDADLTSNAIQSSNQYKRFDELKSGDVIQIQVNEKGKIMSFRVLYEYQDDPEFAYSPESSTTTGWAGERSGAVYFGRINSVSNDTYVLYNNDTPKKKAFVYGKMSYAIYDTKSKKITPISKNDLYAGAKVFAMVVPLHAVDFIIIYK